MLGNFTLNTAIVNYLLFHQGNLHVTPKSLDELYKSYTTIAQTQLHHSVPVMSKNHFISAIFS